MLWPCRASCCSRRWPVRDCRTRRCASSVRPGERRFRLRAAVEQYLRARRPTRRHRCGSNRGARGHTRVGLATCRLPGAFSGWHAGFAAVLDQVFSSGLRDHDGWITRHRHEAGRLCGAPWTRREIESCGNRGLAGDSPGIRSGAWRLERSKGIEPSSSGWEPEALPLSYDRFVIRSTCRSSSGRTSGVLGS